MKGIVLSGGLGTRLYPLTKVTSKQLLPVYNHPMIFYPIMRLVEAGIKEILVIVAPDHAGDYLKYLGSGSDFGVKFTYEIQDSPKGLPEAFIIGEKFIGDDSVALILGDNIFEDSFKTSVDEFVAQGNHGAMIFTKQVHDPERFGVVEFNEDGSIQRIVEKNPNTKSHSAIVGFYIYDSSVVRLSKSLEPSSRGELEIVDLHNKYLNEGALRVKTIDGKWIDAGTFDSLYEANRLAYGWEHEKN